MPITLIDNNNDTQKHYAGIFTLNANKWFLPSGILASNVIAAYQFKGAQSEAEALQNQNNLATLNLAKTGSNVTWNQATGFYIPGVRQAGLNQAGISSFVSVAVRFTGVNNEDSAAGLVAPANGYLLMAKGHSDNINYLKGPTFTPATGTGQTVYTGNNLIQAGTVAYVRNINALYADGMQQSLSSRAWNGSDTFYAVTIGHGTRIYNQNPVFQNINIQAVAFYSTALTAAQVVELTDAMNAL